MCWGGLAKDVVACGLDERSHPWTVQWERPVNHYVELKKKKRLLFYRVPIHPLLCILFVNAKWKEKKKKKSLLHMSISSVVAL